MFNNSSNCRTVFKMNHKIKLKIFFQFLIALICEIQLNKQFDLQFINILFYFNNGPKKFQLIFKFLIEMTNSNLSLILLFYFLLCPFNCFQKMIGNYDQPQSAYKIPQQSPVIQTPQHQKIPTALFSSHKPLQGPNQIDEAAYSMWKSKDGQNYLIHLDSSNFKETVLASNKKTDFLVIFYSHTCPHCQAVAPTLKEFAKSVAVHHNKITIGVYNCKRPFNAIYCRRVKGYPTVLFYTKTAKHYADGKLVNGFGDLPMEGMQMAFQNLLEGKIDLNESEEDLLKLDAQSYMPTINNGIHTKTFLIAFIYGSSHQLVDWHKFAQNCARWKQYVRIGFVDCSLLENYQNPCRTVLGNYSPANLPIINFIYQKMFPNPGKPNSMENWTIQIDRIGVMKNTVKENTADLRRQLVHKLFQANFFNAFTKRLANNFFIDNFQLPFSMANNYNSQISITNSVDLFAYNQPIQFHSQIQQNPQSLIIPMEQMLPQIWRRVNHFMQIYVLIVFEHEQNNMAEFTSKLILSLNHWKRFILILPIKSTNPLARQFANFPQILLYKTGENVPLLEKSYGQFDENADLQATKDIIAKTGLMKDDTRIFDYNHPIECDKLHTRCNSLYFASETDILKALREAIFDEVVTKVEIIEGKERQNLLAFLNILENYLPDYSRIGSQWKALVRTHYARLIFHKMKNLLANNTRISVKHWEMELRKLEQYYRYPFPNATEGWRHCKAVHLLNARGFTCGMWTTFHVLTVNAYKRKEDPRKVLKAIHGWVESFFGCDDCRNHFMEMTTEAMPFELYKENMQKMFNQPVTNIPDEYAVLYLWRAHNIVNERLANEEQYLQEKMMQSDFLFKKQQFPPKFLCPYCEHWNGLQILNFLLDYYERIEPANPMEYFHSWERELAYNFKQWQNELWQGGGM